MSTDTKRPKIVLVGGGLYSATDPRTGKTLTSPSYNHLARQLESNAAAEDRAAAEQTERDRLHAERKADGAARLADLAPKLEAAEQARDRAYEQFRRHALSGGPYVEAFAHYVAAHRRHAGLKIAHNDARHEAQHGEDRRGAPVQAKPETLSEALQKLVDDRFAELRSAAVED